MAAAVQLNSLGTLKNILQNRRNKWPPHLVHNTSTNEVGRIMYVLRRDRSSYNGIILGVALLGRIGEEGAYYQSPPENTYVREHKNCRVDRDHRGNN